MERVNVLNEHKETLPNRQRTHMASAQYQRNHIKGNPIKIRIYILYTHSITLN